MFQCTLTGTLFIFQGQEIGLCNVPKEWSADEYKDVASQNVSPRLFTPFTTQMQVVRDNMLRDCCWYPTLKLQYLEDERVRVRKERGLGPKAPVDISYKMEGLRRIARDNGRTPMQVSTGPRVVYPLYAKTYAVGHQSHRWLLQRRIVDARPR